MKRAFLYTRVSTADQNAQTQLPDLRQLAEQRGYQIIDVFTDHGVSGTRTRRPALDEMLKALYRGQADAVLVWSIDRLARSVKHFVDLLTEFDHLGVSFISYREQIDTAGPLGKAIMTIVAAIAELERSLIIERVRAGLRRARLEGRRLGRKPLEVDRAAVIRDRARGLSLAQLAKAHRISRTSAARILRLNELENEKNETNETNETNGGGTTYEGTLAQGQAAACGLPRSA